VGALLLTLSAVTPASSVFVIVPQVFAQAGTGAFISMAITALLSLPVAYVYAELSSAFPIAGGEYFMVGKTLGPAAGFVTLAMTAVGNMLAPAVLALGAATYLSAVIPGADPRLVGISILVATTLLAVLHVRTNAWVTGACRSGIFARSHAALRARAASSSAQRKQFGHRDTFDDRAFRGHFDFRL
jgi:amino acid transporter